MLGQELLKNDQDDKIINEHFDELIELCLESYNVPKNNNGLKDTVTKTYFNERIDGNNKNLVGLYIKINCKRIAELMIQPYQ